MRMSVNAAFFLIQVSETDNERDDQLKMMAIIVKTVPLQRKTASELITEQLNVTPESKKKEISWSSATYLDKVPVKDLEVRSTSWMLERKASVGPCYRKGMAYGGPSGIMICLPKKSCKNVTDSNPIRSGISISIISKRNLNNQLKKEHARGDAPVDKLKIEAEHYKNLCRNLRGKIDYVCGKIRHAFHM